MTSTNIFTIPDDTVRNMLIRIIRDVDPKVKIKYAYQKLTLQYHGPELDCWPVIKPAIKEYLPDDDAMITIHAHGDYADINVLTNDAELSERCYNLTWDELTNYATEMARTALDNPTWATYFFAAD